MKIKLLRCGICKHWHRIPSDYRFVHCPICGAYRVYFVHWHATYFNRDGVQMIRAAQAGLLNCVIRPMPSHIFDSNKNGRRAE